MPPRPGERLQRASDGRVAVDADRAQVEDRGGTQQDVEGDPDVAQRPPQLPGARHFDLDGQRHHQHADGQVGARQARHEPIGDGAKFRIGEHAENDERVTDDGADSDGTQDGADEQGMRQ